MTVFFRGLQRGGWVGRVEEYILIHRANPTNYFLIIRTSERWQLEEYLLCVGPWGDGNGEGFVSASWTTDL